MIIDSSPRRARQARDPWAVLAVGWRHQPSNSLVEAAYDSIDGLGPDLTNAAAADKAERKAAPALTLTDLAHLPIWVGWCEVTRNGESTKVPFNPKEIRMEARSNNSATWGTREDAQGWVARHRNGGVPLGIGIMFCEIDNGLHLGGVDNDTCRQETGATEPWAQEIIERLATYTEVSPSKTGHKCFFLWPLAAKSEIDRIFGDKHSRMFKRTNGSRHAPGIEVHRSNRFFTVTGESSAERDVLRVVTVEDLRWLVDVAGPKIKGAKSRVRPNGGGDAGGSAKRGELPAALRHMLHLSGAAPAGYESRSELLWAFINEALRRGMDEAAIVASCVDSAFAGCSIYEHIRANGGNDNAVVAYVEKQIESALNNPSTSGGKRIIHIEGGRLHEAWRLTQRALLAANCPVFVRGPWLVWPQWRWEKDGEEGHKFLTCQITRYTFRQLQDMVGRHAVAFTQYDGRLKRDKSIDPPSEVIETLLDIRQWDFPSLVGVINTPTQRPDGSLLMDQGYDEATELWYKASDDITLPPIPERPTREQGLAALDKLKTLLKGFPFEDEKSHAGALAAIMTTVLRGAFHAAPIFLITAPAPRTGKTYLVVLISIVATGHRPRNTAGSPRLEELEKRIETAALAGRAIMHFNNLPNGMVIESEALSQFSTEGIVDIRKLGRHEEGLCDCRATTIFLNGNNVLIAADLVERTVSIRLNAEIAEPGSRTFKFDPIQAVRQHRGDYLAACFTIVRAFRAAGQPTPANMRVVAGFESWSRAVQQPLMWLGCEDPLANQETAAAMDTNREELGRLIVALRQAFNDTQTTFTVADCAKRAEQEVTTKEHEKAWHNEYVYPALREVMIAHGQINTRSFGRLLMKFRDRIHEGWCVKVVAEGRVSTYKLAETRKGELDDVPF